jgi:hypothetical protein
MRCIRMVGGVEATKEAAFKMAKTAQICKKRSAVNRPGRGAQRWIQCKRW